jgi:hypothetical protein
MQVFVQILLALHILADVVMTTILMASATEVL